MGATVYSRRFNGAATHAIVIGVGHYPHLPGGKGRPKFRAHGGMGQLKSPPESARVIARWLIENYAHPDKPLATVSLLRRTFHCCLPTLERNPRHRSMEQSLSACMVM
jgi:hypothetical protein